MLHVDESDCKDALKYFLFNCQWNKTKRLQVHVTDYSNIQKIKRIKQSNKFKR